METEDLIKKIILAYTEISNKTVDSNFKLPYTGKNVQTLRNWIINMKKEFLELSGSRIIDYCIYQIHYWCRIETTYKWDLSWSFGTKAIERYKTMKGGYKYYENIWLKGYGLVREDFYLIFADKKNHPLLRYVYMESEESTKRRFKNTQEGFLLCSSSTLMWSPLSPTCSTCNFQSQCQQITQKRNPELFRLRIEQNKNK